MAKGTPPGLAAALAALKGRKGPAGEDDRPPPSTFPERRVPVIDGQLDLNGDEHGRKP